MLWPMDVFTTKNRPPSWNCRLAVRPLFTSCPKPYPILPIFVFIKEKLYYSCWALSSLCKFSTFASNLNTRFGCETKTTKSYLHEETGNIFDRYLHCNILFHYCGRKKSQFIEKFLSALVEENGCTTPTVYTLVRI